MTHGGCKSWCRLGAWWLISRANRTRPWCPVLGQTVSSAFLRESSVCAGTRSAVTALPRAGGPHPIRRDPSGPQKPTLPGATESPSGPDSPQAGRRCLSCSQTRAGTSPLPGHQPRQPLGRTPLSPQGSAAPGLAPRRDCQPPELRGQFLLLSLSVAMARGLCSWRTATPSRGTTSKGVSIPSAHTAHPCAGLKMPRGQPQRFTLKWDQE